MDLLHKHSTDKSKQSLSLPAALWEATRPRMFPVWVSSALVPASVASLHGWFDVVTFLLEAALCWCLLTLSCWADEYGDLSHGVDNDDRIGPHRPLQRGEISPKQILVACAVLAVVSAAIGLTLVIRSLLVIATPLWVFLVFAAFGILAIICAFTYTMGKKPYGYHGWGDFVAFFFFGPVACVGGLWLYSHVIDWTVLLPAFSIGMALSATINLQNIRDFDNDKANGKNTTAVFLGKDGARRYHYVLVLCVIACYIAFPFAQGMTEPLRFPFVPALIPLAVHLLKFQKTLKEHGPERLDELMWPLCRSMLIACLAFCACMAVPA